MISSKFSLFNAVSRSVRKNVISCNFNDAAKSNAVDENNKDRVCKKNIKTAVNSGVVNEEIRIQGWVRGFRKLKEQVFLDINDGSSFHRLQVVLPAAERPKELTMHSSVDITGVLAQSLKNPANLELHPTSPIKVLGTCHQKSYPFGGKVRYTPDYIRQHVHLRPKTNRFSSLLRVRSATSRAVHDFFSENDFVQIHTPILTSNDCEGAGEVFTVRPDNQSLLSQMSKQSQDNEETPAVKLMKPVNIEDSFFDGKTFLTVSSQLHLEAAASGLEKVWTFSPVFRAENQISTRHLSEFYMVEAELAFSHEISDILQVMEGLVKSVTNKILTDHIGDWQFYMREEVNIRKTLERLLKKPFTVMTYDEACSLLGNIGYPVPDGRSLNREQELVLVGKINNDIPVFVIDWPAKLKPFYMRTCPEDNTKVSAVDLLVPNVGELCGGSLRENNLTALESRIQALGSEDITNSLEWYLDLRRFGSVPSGGFGMGFDRLLQMLTGSGNIKDVTPFPRWAHNCPL